MSKRTRSFVCTLGLSLALLAAGCAGTHQDFAQRPPLELAGTYTMGDGASWLTPCPGSSDMTRRWITFSGKTVDLTNAAKADGLLRPEVPVFLRVRGVAASEVGPDGSGVVVSEILEMRQLRPGECGAR